MKTATKTAAAIDALLLKRADTSFRNHLGASVIGDECGRKLYYDYHWVKAQNWEARMLGLFARGQREEPVFVDYLRGIGCEVWETDGREPLKDGKPQQFRITASNGHFGGSLDAVARGLPDLDPKEVFLCEFKTHNNDSFKKLKEDGIIKTKWKHFVQMQVYMGRMNFQHTLYCAVNKNNDEMFFELVSFDQKIHDQHLSRGGEIIYAVKPPPRYSQSPGNFTCKFCHLNRYCHFGDVTPARNCRTCKYGSPDAKSANWHCDYPSQKTDRILTQEQQKVGCDSYTPNPVLTGVQP